MSAGQMPSSPNFWEGNRGKGLILTGTGLYGTSQAVRNERENHHQKVNRSLERVTRLTEGEMNPAQYVLEASRYAVPSSHIKNDLLSWGGSWQGTDFSNPEAFIVKDVRRISPNPAKKLMRFRDLSCSLVTNPSNKGAESKSELSSLQEGKGILTNNPGLRGGSTEPMELQEVTKKDREMETYRHKFCPSLVYEVCAEQVQAVPDPPVTRTYEFKRPVMIHPIFYYLFSLGFICVSSFLVSYIQHKFSKWTNSQDSASTMQENSSVEALERPSGEEEGSVTKARPEFVIETFLAYKRRLISKKKAAYILVKYYNLSEVDALELLDD